MNSYHSNTTKNYKLKRTHYQLDAYSDMLDRQIEQELSALNILRETWEELNIWNKQNEPDVSCKEEQLQATLDDINQEIQVLQDRIDTLYVQIKFTNTRSLKLSLKTSKEMKRIKRIKTNRLRKLQKSISISPDVIKIRKSILVKEKA